MLDNSDMELYIDDRQLRIAVRDILEKTNPDLDFGRWEIYDIDYHQNPGQLKTKILLADSNQYTES